MNKNGPPAVRGRGVGKQTGGRVREKKLEGGREEGRMGGWGVARGTSVVTEVVLYLTFATAVTETNPHYSC